MKLPTRRAVPLAVLALGLTTALLTAPAWADGGASTGALHLFDAASGRRI